MSQGKQFTISDLEDTTGVSRRTIHFYIKEGLIPPSYGTGGGAYYGEEHLLRLLLIKDLQGSHLKLSGIKEALDRLDLNEMRRLVGKSGRNFPTASRRTLEPWMQGNPKLALSREMRQDLQEGLPAQNYSFADWSQPERRRRQSTDSVPWERHSIADGVEIHLRTDVAELYRKALKEVVALFRKKP